MFAFVRAHISVVVVAMVTAAVTAGGPAIAATIADYAKDADKVDGRHAVGADTPTSERRGKLVATNGATGRLPNNIIAKAPDADRLDGISSTGFARTSLRPGMTLRGEYSAFGSEASGNASDTVNFRIPLRRSFTATTFVSKGEPYTSACPARGRAAPGRLCVYEVEGAVREFKGIFNARTGADGFGPTSFTILFGTSSSSSFSYGEWALKVP